MAFEQTVLNIAGFTATADLSAKQYFCAKLSGTEPQTAVCSAAGEFVFGIIQTNPSASGDTVTLMSLGVSKIKAGGTLAYGDFWGTDASGNAVKVDATNTGGDIGKWAMGQVLTGAATGELATVTIGLGSHLVEAA